MESPRGAGPVCNASQPFVLNAHEDPSGDLSLEAWTTTQVARWMRTTGFNESTIDHFRANDISGAILKGLQFGDLKELGITSFGQRHQLWNAIRTLRGSISVPQTPSEACYSPTKQIAMEQQSSEVQTAECSNPSSPKEAKPKDKGSRRRARRALLSDDIISPAESASIVAIEQLLPEPHKCSKGKECKTWKKQNKKLERYKLLYPNEVRAIAEADASQSDIARPASEAVPSVVASSDVLGPGRLPALRLNEDALRVVQSRDAQENVKQFLSFQHLDEPAEPTTPPYEMFPPLSPPSNTQAPHGNLSRLPKLNIPTALPQASDDPDRTIIRGTRSPLTAMEIKDRNSSHDILRFASPASAMDVPVTAIPLGPIERDTSSSVPPNMRFGFEPLSRSVSRSEYRHEQLAPISRPHTTKPIERATSHASRRQQPAHTMAPVEECTLTPTDHKDEPQPSLKDVNHEGWMKKRKTKMLRHEWHENHFRLNGTRLAMRRDSKALEALEYIDVDEYAVACSSLASNKLNNAFKTLKINNKKKDSDAAAFSFQLVPAIEKRGILGAASGKTHHFAVKAQDERIDWMRQLMLAKALKQKSDGCEVNVNGNMV